MLDLNGELVIITFHDSIIDMVVRLRALQWMLIITCCPLATIVSERLLVGAKKRRR